ncbi:V-type ATP synthase subunit E [Enterococcus saccharolyticus]|uniref:ATPase n=1 Tax=Candidatus Enterococcus willemsii TaxID=1857215 RepID=A0ABQ6YWI9_9ENTE|nr:MULTISPECIES: V-type ATP synthase subunit E [Enterococcus]KAF1302051.1 ATPase [Enterococcus sp. CU12B]MCD5002840.1 V-type ATP synthase subunit E [Enterococcus saccharolyticus]
MSDITKLTSKIIQDAQVKRQQMLEAGEKEIQQQEKLQQQQIERQMKEQLQRAEKEIQAELSLKVSDLHVKSRSKLLATKQIVLDELFAEAKDRLRQLSATDFTDFVLRNIKATNLEGEMELVLGEESQHYATEKTIAAWQQELLPDIQLTVAKQVIPRRSGFLLRQGEVEFNFIFEAILNASEEELSNELLQLIFEE